VRNLKFNHREQTAVDLQELEYRNSGMMEHGGKQMAPILSQHSIIPFLPPFSSVTACSAMIFFSASPKVEAKTGRGCEDLPSGAAWRRR
jgi:hypothetical protein